MSVLRNARRTPFGAFGGRLKAKSPTDLAECATIAALTDANLPASAIDSIFVGNVIQSHKDTAYIARHLGTRVGADLKTPALTVNRLCGSGFQSVISAIHAMIVDGDHIAVAAGSENMSEVPFVLRNMRFGTKLGVEYKLEDPLPTTLFDFQSKVAMGITAENLASDYNISREACDEFALSSQTRWKKGNSPWSIYSLSAFKAHEDGVFKPELVPIELKGRKGVEIFNTDEHARDTTAASLAKLPPVFLKDGVVTAGNASGICDGAASLILATEQALEKYKLKALARITGYSVVGCEPTRMGLGPVPAVNQLLKAMHKNTCSEAFDLIEVNEAFASQYLAVEQALTLDRQKTNVHGGAIAMGHPVGASGTRIMAHLAHQVSSNAKYKTAIGSACIGGGQGIAIAIESVN